MHIDSTTEITTPEPLISSPSTPQFTGVAGLFFAPADQQKAVTRADEMWIPRMWAGQLGFIGGVVVAKNKRSKWIMMSGW